MKALLLLLLPAAALEVPYLTGRVTDEAGLLSAEAQARIEGKLRAFEGASGAQLAVLTLPSLEGEDLEGFSLRTAETWKLGRKGKDDGVLFLVAQNDRKMRIEVGYGLEEKLPDGLAGEILRTEVTPRFRGGDFEGGIEAGVDAIIAAAGGGWSPPEQTAEDLSRRLTGSGLDIELPPWPLRILMGLFVFSILGLFECIGIFALGGEGWFLYFFLIPFWSMFPMVIVGPYGALCIVAAHLLGFPVLKLGFRRTELGQKLQRVFGQKGGGSGGSGGSWSSSSSSWSSSSSSGGFSGGGGSFGGGGSSGSW